MQDLSTKDLMKGALQRVSPRGVDIYWDNTGGPISDAVFEHLAVRARVIVCGSISQYGHLDDAQQAQGPRFLHHFLYKRATLQGVLARDYTHRNDEMISHLRPLVESKRLVLPETFMHGFEQLPHALAALFEGKNTGKMIVSAE
jgi:NADPH-dependent curcumin reductase CurA